MENKNRFRNHISVILERSVKSIGAVIFMMGVNFFGDAMETGIQFSDVAFLVGFVVAAIAIILGFHALIWSRTYITLEENTLVVEKNTLNRKKNTIGLKNISNVNLEQNILQMILGTCKVKLDTNSLSTADETDVDIVLKKEEAEQFRRLVLNWQNVDASVDANIATGDVTYDATCETNVDETIKRDSARMEGGPENSTVLQGDMGDIVLHGFWSIRISTVLFLIFMVAVQAIIINDMNAHEMGIQDIGGGDPDILSSILMFYGVIIATAWTLVREFFKYLNFKIERKGDKIFLNYGLFKKVAYSIPVDKINGIRLTQTPIARIAKRYMVEVINVGMDDNENESNTFFLPYGQLEKVKNQLHIILPEFDGCMDVEIEKQPAARWILYLPWLVLYAILVVVSAMVAESYSAEAKVAILIVGVLLFVWWLATRVAEFLTRGVAVGPNFLTIVEGGFKKEVLFVKYHKIQYITTNQCVIAKHFQIQKGMIYLLASTRNRLQRLPYFKENEMEVLKNSLI